MFSTNIQVWFSSDLCWSWSEFQGSRCPQVTWVQNWVHLTQSILEYSFILWINWEAGKIPRLLCQYKWLTTRGKLLGTGVVSGFWSSRKPVGKCEIPSACEMLFFLLSFKVICITSHFFFTFSQAYSEIQYNQLKALWGQIDLSGISCVLGGKQEFWLNEIQGLNACKSNHLFGKVYIWTLY